MTVTSRVGRGRLSARFLKSLRKHRDLIPRVKKSLRLLFLAPESPSIHLEPLVGMPGLYSIRVNLQFRILLRSMEDHKGKYWLIVDLDTHRIYQR